MAEVLFYEHPVPLNRAAHKDLRLKNVANAKFALGVHSVPLTVGEFSVAARDLPIVFAGQSVEDCVPIALLGLRQDENLFVDAEGKWAQNVYVPAFVRRYPFVLAEKPKDEEGGDFTVFLDEQYEGFDQAEGERLFKEDGTDSEMLTKTVGFLGEFQQQMERTRWFVEQLRKYDLLEARNMHLEKDGKGINLNGLFIVNEEKLRALDAKTTHEFLREGVLGWVFAHLLSLINIDRVSQRLVEREQAQAAAGATKN